MTQTPLQINWIATFAQLALTWHSRVARGGAIVFPIGLPTKMQNKENTTFLALLRLFFVLEWTKK